MKNNEEAKQGGVRNIALLLTLVATPLTLLLSVAPKEFIRGAILVPISLYPGLTFVMLVVSYFLVREKPTAGGFLVLTSVPRSWITLSWVVAGALIYAVSTLTILGLIPSKNTILTIYRVIYVVICSTGLLCLALQWFTQGVKLPPFTSPARLVLFFFFFISSLPLYQAGGSLLFIGFAQSLFLLACLTGQNESDLNQTDPLIPRMVFACAAGFLVMSSLLSFFHTELSTKPAALLFLPSLPLIICVLTYSGIRAVQPFKK